MATRCTNKRTRQSLPLSHKATAINTHVWAWPGIPVIQCSSRGKEAPGFILCCSKLNQPMIAFLLTALAQDLSDSQHPCQAAHSLLPLYLWGIGWLHGRLHSCAHNHTKTNTHIIKNNKEKSLQKDMEKISCTLK